MKANDCNRCEHYKELPLPMQGKACQLSRLKTACLDYKEKLSRLETAYLDGNPKHIEPQNITEGKQWQGEVAELTTIVSVTQLYSLYRANKQKCLFFAPILNEWIWKYAINTPKRIWAFLATIAVESGRLLYVEELASGAAYEGRKDLGNVCAGDGERYKGRGLIQITGRANYQKVGMALGIDCLDNPKILRELPYCVSASCWWWWANGCNEVADTCDTKAIRRRVNGGLNGYSEFLTYYERAKTIWK